MGWVLTRGETTVSLSTARMPQPLLLLLVGVPPTPSSLRVRVWRRLRLLGAVALKRSAYLLPDTPERYEDFQWLAQEIQRGGGDATLIRVQEIENPELAQQRMRELYKEKGYPDDEIGLRHGMDGFLLQLA